MVTHIALFKLKTPRNTTDIERVWKPMEALPRRIPGILDSSRGPEISVEGFSKDFSHSCVLTFENVSTRDAYLPHAAHTAAVDVVLPKLEKVMAIDHPAA